MLSDADNNHEANAIILPNIALYNQITQEINIDRIL